MHEFISQKHFSIEKKKKEVLIFESTHFLFIDHRCQTFTAVRFFWLIDSFFISSCFQWFIGFFIVKKKRRFDNRTLSTFRLVFCWISSTTIDFFTANIKISIATATIIRTVKEKHVFLSLHLVGRFDLPANGIRKVFAFCCLTRIDKTLNRIRTRRCRSCWKNSLLKVEKRTKKKLSSTNFVLSQKWAKTSRKWKWIVPTWSISNENAILIRSHSYLYIDWWMNERIKNRWRTSICNAIQNRSGVFVLSDTSKTNDFSIFVRSFEQKFSFYLMKIFDKKNLTNKKPIFNKNHAPQQINTSTIRPSFLHQSSLLSC